ncbi:MAG TPA: AbrB/MazE/SpoVT family DNA-binding domain-containing protein [Steroidobacteraceae bacterium]|nr:AbrB/MazE/SpoVT family DNA-binding domain-containing protein [Steroidobacteraceae bacterium]
MIGADIPRVSAMSRARLTEKGQIVIPAEIREKYGLTPGTQVEFVDEGGAIRLVIGRRVTPSDPAAGYGLVRLQPRGKSRHLAEFDAASLLGRAQSRRLT